jgi:chromosome segregation ATPase
MPKPDSPLTAAAAAFDAELVTYARLAELFLKTPLTSLKHLERANQTIGEIADSEQRLQDAGKQLIEALTGARQKQEDLSNAVVAYAPTVQARNSQLKDLMTAMSELAGEVAKLNTLVAPTNGGGESEADPGEISGAVLQLSTRAEELAKVAHDAEFEELATQAHSLHQRLKAIGTKLQKAAGN